MTKTMRLILIVAAVLLALLALVRLSEKKFIYFPSKYPEGFWEPNQLGLSVEDCYFRTEDGVTLHGWFVPGEGRGPTLLWCHGNAGNLSHRFEQMKELHEYLGVHIFIFDYRGYGRSEGSPSEEGLYRDAVAAYDYLLSRSEVDRNAIFAFGQSLGGAVIIELTRRGGLAGIIVESTFTSVKDVAKEMFGGLPMHWFIKTRYDSIQKIGKVGVPVLVIHGAEDSTISWVHSQRLFKAAAEPKALYLVEGAGHNDVYIVGGQHYYRRLREFVVETLAKSGT